MMSPTPMQPRSDATPTAHAEAANEITKSLGAQIRKSILVGGSALMGGGTVLFAVVELLKSEPDKGFRLLHDWGPWCFLVFFVAWIVNGWVTRAIDFLESIGNRFADSVDRVAAEQKRLADSQDLIAKSSEAAANAAQITAEKDNREQDRLSTLIEYSAQQSREAMTEFRNLQPTLAKLSAQLDAAQIAKAALEASNVR